MGIRAIRDSDNPGEAHTGFIPRRMPHAHSDVDLNAIGHEYPGKPIRASYPVHDSMNTVDSDFDSDSLGGLITHNPKNIFAIFRHLLYT